MHEFSLAQQIEEIVVETASDHELSRVTEVRLQVGTASGVSIDALQFAWDYLRTTDDRTEGAELAIEQVQAAGSCSACGYRGELRDSVPICPECGTGGFRLSCGAEFVVSGISGE